MTRTFKISSALFFVLMVAIFASGWAPFLDHICPRSHGTVDTPVLFRVVEFLPKGTLESNAHFSVDIILTKAPSFSATIYSDEIANLLLSSQTKATNDKAALDVWRTWDDPSSAEVKTGITVATIGLFAGHKYNIVKVADLKIPPGTRISMGYASCISPSHRCPKFPEF